MAENIQKKLEEGNIVPGKFEENYKHVEINQSRDAAIKNNSEDTMDAVDPGKNHKKRFKQLQQKFEGMNKKKSIPATEIDQSNTLAMTDNELWYSDSESSSDEEYYYQRKKYWNTDNEEKPKSVEDDVMHDYWIKNIETPIKCNGKDCHMKKMKGCWYTCECMMYDFCSNCAIKYENKNPVCDHNLVNIIAEDTKLMRAIRLKEEDLAAKLLDDEEIFREKDMEDFLGFSAVFLAILYLPGIKLLQRLIKKGVDVNTLAEHGKTLLLLAVQRKHTEAANFLLSKEIEVTSKEKKISTETEMEMIPEGKNTLTEVISKEKKYILNLKTIMKLDYYGKTILINALINELPGVAKESHQKKLGDGQIFLNNRQLMVHVGHSSLIN